MEFFFRIYSSLQAAARVPILMSWILKLPVIFFL